MHAQERTYRAPRFSEAMAQVKKELGRDAVILSSRQVRGGRLGGGMVEITAAPPGFDPDRNTGRGRSEGEHNTAPYDRHGNTGGTRQAETLLEERLARTGIPRRAAAHLVQQLRLQEGRLPTTLLRARDSLEVVLGDELLFSGPVLGRPRGPRAIALVGPTGVGKTTTIAKIAALAALLDRRQVALISTDDYRIGGADQLQRYADLIGIPMTAVDASQGKKGLRRALKAHSHADLVFIDTAGRSPMDKTGLAETAEVLAGAGEPVETHLCIPAAISDIELRAVLDRHQVLEPTRLLATKLDEAVYHGSIVAAQAIAGLPISYFTTGQRVPEDLEVAGAERLAGLICGEELGA